MAHTEDAVRTEQAPAAPPVSAPHRRRRWPRVVAIVSIVLIVVLIAGSGGIAWYFSSQGLALVHDKVTYSQRVLALTPNTVTITQTDNTVRPGTYRLMWRGGQVMLGAIVSKNGTGVTRRYTGNAQGLKVGTPVHFDALIYSSPAALGLSYKAVKVSDPLGPMPAWFIPRKGKTWVIVVHGRGMGLTEAMRPLPALAGFGLPVLSISYRNDSGAPSSSDRVYHFGATEWQDLQAAVKYALAHGARNLILYGFSLGANIAESFLHRSSYAGKVRAAVLDSPALDWSAIFTYRAPGYLPSPEVDLSKQVIAWRIGLANLDETSKLLPAVNFKVKTLLMQGTGDTSIPPSRNAQLARMRPNQVTYVSFQGGEHTQLWNNNRTRYTKALKSFLAQVLQQAR